jgi:hypothetical protein
VRGSAMLVLLVALQSSLAAAGSANRARAKSNKANGIAAENNLSTSVFIIPAPLYCSTRMLSKTNFLGPHRNRFSPA